MKRSLLDILACPVCKHHPLDLEVVKEDAEGISEGKLTCPQCRVDYPIIQGIPDLMPPSSR